MFQSLKDSIAKLENNECDILGRVAFIFVQYIQLFQSFSDGLKLPPRLSPRKGRFMMIDDTFYWGQLELAFDKFQEQHLPNCLLWKVAAFYHPFGGSQGFVYVFTYI